MKLRLLMTLIMAISSPMLLEKMANADMEPPAFETPEDNKIDYYTEYSLALLSKIKKDLEEIWDEPST